ncbi:hypothetical protein KY285_010121 [Solanum tuberosum]|nr:hypothetical protein KY285_010121 [Solanum tuberosum]
MVSGTHRQTVEENKIASSIVEDHRVKAEKDAKFIKLQDKRIEEFLEERENTIIRAHEDRRSRRKHWKEEIALDKKFDIKLAKLMEKYFTK